MADLIRKPLAWLTGLLLIAAATLWFTGLLSGARRAEVTARFETHRGDAAVRSGADAANTIGERGSAEQALDKEITHAQDQVRAAPDTGAAHSAARNGLCGISPNYCD
jgi:hypothetical protein